MSPPSSGGIISQASNQHEVGSKHKQALLLCLMVLTKRFAFTYFDNINYHYNIM
jgi:hypothetical protein